MSGRSAWGIAIADMVAIIVAAVVAPTDASVVLWFAVVALFSAIGALLISRVPTNRIGVLFLAAATLQVVSVVSGSYADAGRIQTPAWPGTEMARLIGDVLFFYPMIIVLVGVPLIFPDGHLPSPRFRIIAAIAILDLAAWTLNDTVGAGLDTFVLVATVVAFGGGIAAVGVRFRRGDAVQRQQVKWFMADAALAAILIPVAFSMPDPETAAIPGLSVAVWLAAVLAMAALPIAIGIAVLRYRLYEIDRIVSRTIGYGVVTGVLVVTFAAAVITFETVLAGLTDTGGETLAVAASTLVVFALFQPLRKRVQRTVDRRFDRSRYDGERTSAAFSERLRSEVDLTTVTADLDATVRRVMAPTAMGVWLRGDPADAA